MNHQDMLDKIDTLYEGRQTGDISNMEKVLAPGAEFQFAGEKTIVDAFPGGSSGPPSEIAAALFEQLDMHSRERVESIIEGHKVAVLTKATLCTKDGEPFEHLMFDLWEFNDDGLITRGRQFQDTAKIIAELS